MEWFKKNKKNVKNHKFYFRVKSSEEIILEEMQKFKFYANPINRSIFRLSENAKPFVRKCCLPKKIEREIANDTVKERKIFSCSKAFSAKPLPNFTLFEVKKSSRLLTVPVSPKLKTKSRSVSYRNKMLNNIH